MGCGAAPPGTVRVASAAGRVERVGHDTLVELEAPAEQLGRRRVEGGGVERPGLATARPTTR